MRKAYKILRNILFSILLTLAVLYVALYVALSLPPVQNFVKEVACSELNRMTGGRFSVERVSISPFNKVILQGVALDDPEGKPVARIETVGAGIAIWRLIMEQEIVITFGEIVGLDGHITQAREGEPTNIQFLIDAFASKDNNKPPKPFDLQINNIVLRRCAVTYDRLWVPRMKDKAHFDASHVRVTDLAADLRLPVMRNDDFVVDLRRLSLHEASGFTLESLSGRFVINANQLAVSDLLVKLPGTTLSLGDFDYPIQGFKNLPEQLRTQPLHLSLTDTRITPADFSAFLPALANYPKPLTLTLNANYHRGDLSLDAFNLRMPEGIDMRLRAKVTGLEGKPADMRLDLPMLMLTADGDAVSALITDFMTLPASDASLIRRLGSIRVNASGRGSLSGGSLKTGVESALGTAQVQAVARRTGALWSLDGEVSTAGFEVGRLLDNDMLGRVAVHASGAARVGKGVLDGHVELDAPLVEFKGYSYHGLTADLTKQGTMMRGSLAMLDENVDFDIEGEADLAGTLPHVDLHGAVRTLRLSPLNLASQYADAEAAGVFDVSLSGNSLDNLNGYADFSDLHFSNTRFPNLALEHLRLESNHEALPYSLSLESDLLSASVTGDFNIAGLPASMRRLGAYFLPTLIGECPEAPAQAYDWQVKINHSSPLLAQFKLPITLLEDLELSGSCDTRSGRADMSMEIPYLQQGKDKLIRDTRLKLDVDTATNLCRLNLSTKYPNKKGDIDLSLQALARGDSLHTDVGWRFDRPRSYAGGVSLTSLFGTPTPEGRPVTVLVNPSKFVVNDTVWQVDPARMRWESKTLSIDSVCVHRPGQQAFINGVASASAEDELLVALRNIDLDYVFESLNINYVTFGGRASGDVKASALLSPRPVLRTDGLAVASLTYNNSLLGDALIKSYFDNDQKSVRIDADVTERSRKVATIGGDIFVTRDSLSIGIAADSVNVGFLQPFMAAFSSAVEGRASGHVQLYGTFKDIDLTGRVHADSLRMKVDVTNTWYSACDSVIIDPGLINLSNITLRDRDGHTALLNGEVRHRYFHDPTFDFVITKARNFLCYDTGPADNPRWWGTIYGNGSGKMHGVPGYITVEVDMTSAPGSTFTFVLDDREEAVDYEFITFSDRRREAEELRLREQLASEQEEPEFLQRFRRMAEQQEQGPPTRYEMDLRMTANPDVKVNIIMDPVAGDKIAATGGGNLRMTYNSDDELNLYGTYTLAQGFYNFTLQDLIVRDFKIREGSKISFNGDPLRAMLSLTAAYRVNTSLTELDKSFATDRELNRTNVPVEALLKVNGEMQSPEITFDLDFPTLSADVASKVRSIVSTSDMMNRQIIYLLALNRFYTPDYMNGENNNNELASVASTTLSTQLGQMLGQLAPGWTFSPYFRTDKGDFSDMEVDLALSSALFNNRLLLNGNLGYRDRSTSNTTFVGDFDIEYLLNPSGSLRLKAYNHFNDQNYYLRSALTTQGLGIVYKRDFNRFLPGLFRKRRPKTAPADTTKK